MTKQVVFWQKVFVNRDENGKKVPSFPVLVSCKATVVGDSEPICGLCREPERVHAKLGRRHPFTNPVGGKTLEVTYAGGGVAGKTKEHLNVQQSKEANCWTEAEV